MFYLCPFLCKPRRSGVSLKYPGLENLPKVPGNRAKVDQDHDAGKAVSATLSVLKCSRAICWLQSSKTSARSFYLCLILWKPSPSGISFESPGLKYIPQVPENRAKVGQDHDAVKAVSATLSVLKWSGDICRPKSSKPSVWLFYLCPFLCKPRPSRVSLESQGLKNIPQVQGNRAKVGQDHAARKAVWATLWVLK